MLNDAVIASLKSLKLHGMASAMAELAEQDAPAYQASSGLLDQLIRAEVADREVRSIKYQMNIARFPAYRDLAGFGFADSAVSETLVPAADLAAPPSYSAPAELIARCLAGEQSADPVSCSRRRFAATVPAGPYREAAGEIDAAHRLPAVARRAAMAPPTPPSRSR